ncbi:hypothetical protein ACWEIJ_29910 [Lentzea sp. NPDC004789]
MSLWRVPAIAVLTTALLTALSIVLDTGGERSRDLALLVGALTFYLVAPATVICVVVATVVEIRRRRRVR